MEKLKIYAKKIWAYIVNTYHDLLPEPEQKVIFWVGGGLIYSLIAYMVAALDIGIKNHDCSIPGMIALYLISPEEHFPLSVWLLLATLLFVLVVWLVVKFSQPEDSRNFKLSDSDVYGNSKDISDDELRAICEIAEPEKTDKMILGMAPNSTRNVLGAIPEAMDNPNVAFVGTPGAGKSESYCVPIMMQVMRRRESIVCSDTKGELYARTSEIFRENGYVVKKLDLRNPIMSNGWNVLKEMRHDQARAQVFVNTIISNCNISDNYAGFAANLLTAISLYVERNPSMPEREKNLATVYKMITTDADNLDSSFKKAKSIKELKPAVGAYSAFLKSSDSLAGNMINNLASAMGILAAEPVQEMLSEDDIDLTLPGQVPCVYYVIMSDQDDTFKFLASLFFAFLFQDLVEFADMQDNQKLPVRCTVLLEEFAQVKIPNIDKKLSTCRSRGIPIILIVQTITQLQKEYPKDWETMLDTCAIQICLAANGDTTAKYFEKKCGETTTEVKTEQHDIRAILGTGRYSTGYGKRSFRTADEIRRIPRYHSLIVWQRYNTLITKTFPAMRHPAYPYMKKTSAFTTVPLTDLAAREYIRQYEEKRIRVMSEWIREGGRPMWYCDTPKLTIKGPQTGNQPPKFMTYRELEQKALQYSKDHPEILAKMIKQREDERLAEVRRLKAEVDGPSLEFEFAEEKMHKYKPANESRKNKSKTDTATRKVGNADIDDQLDFAQLMGNNDPAPEPVSEGFVSQSFHSPTQEDQDRLAENAAPPRRSAQKSQSRQSQASQSETKPQAQQADLTPASDTCEPEYTQQNTDPANCEQDPGSCNMTDNCSGGNHNTDEDTEPVQATDEPTEDESSVCTAAAETQPDAQSGPEETESESAAAVPTEGQQHQAEEIPAVSVTTKSGEVTHFIPESFGTKPKKRKGRPKAEDRVKAQRDKLAQKMALAKEDTP